MKTDRQSMLSVSVALPFFLVVLSFMIRLSLISKGPFHGDAVMFAMAVERSVAEGHLHYLHSHGFPLTAILGILFYKLFLLLGIDHAVWSINCMSVLFSALSTFPLYYIIKTFFDELTAVIGSILFMITPLFLTVSVYGNSQTPAVFFIFSAIACLLQYFKYSQKLYFYAAAVCLGLAGAARAQELAVMLIPILIIYLSGYDAFASPEPKQRRSYKVLIREIVTASIVCAAVILFFYAPVLLAKAEITSNRFLTQELSGYFKGMFSRYMLTSAGYMIDNFRIVGVVIILSGAALAWIKYRQTFYLLIGWFLIPFFAFGNLQISSHRLFVLAIVPLIIFQAFAVSFLWRQRSNALRTSSAILLIILVSVSYTRIFPILGFRHRHAVTADFVKWIAANTEEDSFVITNQDRIFMVYYTNRRCASYIPIYPHAPQTVKEIKKRYQKLYTTIMSYLNNNKPVYITEAGLYGDHTGTFEKYILKNFDLTPVGVQYYETWHRSELDLTVVPVQLFRMTRK